MRSGWQKDLPYCKGWSFRSRLSFPAGPALILAAAFQNFALSAILQSLVCVIGAISNSPLGGVMADGVV